MTHGVKHKAEQKASDYANLRTIPAVLSVAFVVASLFAFGGINNFHIVWFGGYDLTSAHAMGGSLGVYALAFASSETREFQNYAMWESALIAAGPISLIGWEYFTEFQDLALQLGDPLGAQALFVLTIASWGAATQ